jgi:pyruvate/2-oxoacid:ferredoxin oxidoreductase beta subunit
MGREDARGMAECNEKMLGERQYRVKEYQVSFAVIVIRGDGGTYDISKCSSR